MYCLTYRAKDQLTVVGIFLLILTIALFISLSVFMITHYHANPDPELIPYVIGGVLWQWLLFLVGYGIAKWLLSAFEKC